MEPSAILLRPNYDTTTAYLHEWSAIIKNFAETKGLDIFDLSHLKATHKTFISYLQKNNSSLIIFNCHGSSTALFGHNNEILLSSKDSSMVKDKTIYARSCQAGSNLGLVLVKQGVKAFIGYKRDFIFPFDTNKTTTPLRDDVCKPIFECSNKIAFTLIKGGTPQDAHSRSMDAYDYWIRHYIDDHSIEAPQIIRCLLWNQMNQVCIEN
jgi:hypothetical protein